MLHSHNSWTNTFPGSHLANRTMCWSFEKLQLKAEVELMPEKQCWRLSRSKQILNGKEKQQDESLLEGMSSCRGSSARKRGHLDMRGHEMGGLMQQRTSAREVHATRLPNKTALVIGGKLWQRSGRSLWEQMRPNSPGSLSSPPAELLGGARCPPSPHWWGKAASFSPACSAALCFRWT